MDNIKNQRIDIARGIGIILVVYGHACSNSRVVSLFHMPLFFIISGYCYRREYGKDMKSIVTLIKKRLRSLYIPYVGYNLFYLFTHNILCFMNLYSSNELLIGEYGLVSPLSFQDFIKQFILIMGFIGGEQLNGACWFLRVLFLLTILTAICDMLICKLANGKKQVELLEMLVSILFLIIGWLLCLQNNLLILQIPVVFSMYIFFQLGRMLGESKWEIKNPFILVFNIVWGGVALYIAKDLVHVSVAANQYSNPFFLVIFGVIGYMVVHSLVVFSSLLSIGQLLAMVGKHTIAIMSLHFLSFKSITYIIVKLRKEPPYMLASFPHHPNEGSWWIAYVLVGVGFPVFVDILLKKLFVYITKYKG